MIKVYFIRHGETEWNKIGRFQGWTDIPLSEHGLKQAEALGKRFEREGIQLDRIYASPLIRAVQTAQPLSDLYGLPIETIDCFKEMNYGEWDGLTFTELKQKYGREFIGFILAPHKGTFPGEGTFDNVVERVKPGLEQVFGEENKDKTIAVVGHGGIIRLTLFYLLGMDYGLYNNISIENTGVSLYEVWDNGRKILQFINDYSHLNGV